MEILISEETRIARRNGSATGQVAVHGFHDAKALIAINELGVGISVHVSCAELRAIGNAAIKVADAIDRHAAELAA